MASACPPPEYDELSETKNIICCLLFLADEAMNAELPVVFEIISNTITKIINLDADKYQYDVDRDFGELVSTFKTFIKFYLMGSDTARDELIEMISNIDREQVGAYVH